MTQPILVYGSVGAGGSMLIWTIKKVRYLQHPVNDPVTSLGTAHGQFLLPHWFGGNKEFESILSLGTDWDRIVHCEPSYRTCEYADRYPSFNIYFEDDEDVMQSITLAQAKVPEFAKHTPDRMRHIVDGNPCTRITLSGALNITFKQLFYGPIESLLNNIADYLKLPPVTDTSILVAAYTKWRQGNHNILNK